MLFLYVQHAPRGGALRQIKFLLIVSVEGIFDQASVGVRLERSDLVRKIV